MSEDKEPLPVCRLCGGSANRQQGQFAGMVKHELAQSLQRMCPLELWPMTEDQWRALMAPPPDESHLLRTLADIREALGVGAKPMLDELPGLVRGMADRIKELEAAWAMLWDKIHALCALFNRHSPTKEDEA